MRRISSDKRIMIVNTPVQGSSVNATAHISGARKLTVLRLLDDVGLPCRNYHDLAVRGLPSRRVQCNET